MNDAQDKLSLSGLEYYSLGDYKRLFVRRKWLILFVTLVVAVATAVGGYFLPNSFKATTVILVDPQRVPDYYVNSTVTTGVVDRLATLRQQILSSTRLSQIIDEMGLYKDLKRSETQEEIVEKMRKDISVETATASRNDKSLEAFSVSYMNQSPVVAANVTNRLASLFIEENIKGREASVLGTADFVTKELEDAQKDLKEKEDRVAALKSKNPGETPEEETIHVQAINSLEIELANERQAISQAQQQKVYLESVLGDTPSVVNMDSEELPEISAMQAELSQLESQSDELRKRYGPNYPDVIKKTIQIQDLQTRIDDTKKASGTGRPKTAPSATKKHNPVIESQIATLDAVIQKRQQQEQQIMQQITMHQSQLERIPIFQQEVSAMKSDLENAQDNFKHLQERKFQADMAADLEMKQKGERFEILDPAQVPYKPDSPNRPLINMIGLAAGLLIGLASALGVEVSDPSVKTEREVVGQLGAPVFGEIPWLPTKRQSRKELMRTIFASLGSAALVAVYVIVVIMTWH
jgi:succinoglycan biosynthesis transport protein ExoP